MTPFDTVKNIQNHKYDFNEHDYNPFMVNRIFSMNPSTLFVADKVNKMGSLPKEMQHDFYFNLISGGGYIKYITKNKQNKNEQEQIEQIQNKFKVNKQQAIEYLSILRSKKLI